jgi:hypothetical protein
MSPQPESPLTAEHLQQIKNALDAVKRAKVQIELAKRANVPLGDLEQTNLDNEAKLINLKQVYFPGQ